jgi:methyltransferase (TIGR00027 family)
MARVQQVDRPDDGLPPVGLTAVGVAAVRAAESTRPDRLFTDPFAAPFADAAGWSGRVPDDTAGRRQLATWIAVRTRFLDDVLLDAGENGCRQVVILGAGLDARSFRLPWPTGTTVWELDLPEVLDFKEQVVRAGDWHPTCRRHGVPVDLAADWGDRLVERGLDTGAPVAWLAEGLLPYLSEMVNDHVLSVAASLSTPGSRMGLTVASPQRLEAWRAAHPEGPAERGDYVALWQSTGPESPRDWLASYGWTATVYEAAERSSAYGRAPGDIGGEMLGAGLVDAIRS